MIIIKSTGKSILAFSLFLVITIISCDPGRVLIIKAANKPNVSVTVFGNENMFPQNRGNKKVVLEIPNNDQIPKYDTNFFYGLGVWREIPEIDFFSNNVDSIIIRNSKNTEILKDKNIIKQYLLRHRSGPYKSAVLTIEAK